MVTLVLFLIILMALPIYLAGRNQSRFEDTLYISCISIVTILFAFGLCSILFIGVIAVIAIALVLYGLTIYSVVRKKTTLSAIVDNMLTPAMFVFVAVVGLIVYIDYGKLATISDEFSHWMSIVRSMAQVDDFGTNPSINAPFASYPPGMSLFQYFLIRLDYLFGSNTFAEWKVYFAYQIMAVATMLPFVKATSNKIIDVITKIILWVPLLILPLVFFGEYYNSVYVDPYLGIAAASAMAMIITCEKKDWKYRLFIISACVMLVLTKDVGTLMAFVIALAYIADYFYLERKNEHLICIKNLLAGFGPLIGTLLAKTLWNLEVSLSNVPKKFSAPFDFSQLVAVLNGSDETYRNAVYINYKIKMRTTEIPMGIMDFTYWQLIVIFIVILLDILIRLNIKKKISIFQTGVVAVLSTALVYGYSLGLLPLYLFRFSDYEAVNLASFDRYIGIVMLFGLMLLWMLFIYLFSTYEEKKGFKLVLSVVLLYMVFSCNRDAVKTQMIRFGAVNTQAIRMQYDAAAAEIIKNCEQDSDVLVVFTSDDGLKNAMLEYMVGYNYNLNEICIEGWEANDDTKLDIQNQIDNNDYVVTTNGVADILRDQFDYLFDSDEEIKDNTVYLVDGSVETLQRQ